ncbi:hypothetical protein D3C87_1182920 [compost metagenome]
MAKINGYYVTVEKEELGFDVEITQQPVEKDINVIDHVQRKARTIALSGQCAGKDAAKIHRFLIEASDKGEAVEFIGRSTFKGLMSGLTTSRDYTIADGFNFSFTITEVRFANSSFVSKLPTPIKAQAAKIVNSGVKQTKDNKKGTKAKGKGKSKKKGKEPVQKVKFKKGSPWASAK